MENVRSLIDLVKNYKIEAVLIGLAFVITCISLGLFLSDQRQEEIKPKITLEKTRPQTPSIVVDVEGAVANPGVYQLSQNARVVDAVKISGGLSEQADLLFFFRNFNQAGVLSDQQKIYIPSQWEVLSNLYSENPVVDNQTESSKSLISINNASASELEELPAVGKVTAEKISSNRPYTSTEELLEKNVVGKATFDKIKDLISID